MTRAAGLEVEVMEMTAVMTKAKKRRKKVIISSLSSNIFALNLTLVSTATGEDAIVDETETNLIALRRTIYLTIQSSLDHNECAHKMMKMQMKPGQEPELCHMILDCCAQQRTYEKFFGLLAQVLTIKSYFHFYDLC